MKTHAFIDIETLGQRPGCAVVSIAAIAFDVDPDGNIGDEFSHFSRIVKPSPLCGIEPETADWWEKKGGYPTGPDAIPLGESLDHLMDWSRPLKIFTWWAWGASFDFPILEEAARRCLPARFVPWRYYQTTCARGPWRLAFGTEKHASRPHDALEDARASLRDLRRAMAFLRNLNPASDA
jgi:DNA polymerase III epsilon subunit-like protein